MSKIIFLRRHMKWSNGDLGKHGSFFQRGFFMVMLIFCQTCLKTCYRAKRMNVLAFLQLALFTDVNGMFMPLWFGSKSYSKFLLLDCKVMKSSFMSTGINVMPQNF